MYGEMCMSLCSCVVCKEVKSVKGIHSHYIISHTKEGNARAKANGAIHHGEYHQSVAHKESLAKYEESPNLCQQCRTPLEYQKRNNKFCSHSCAALFSNKARNLDEQVKALRLTLSLKPKYTKIHQEICKECAEPFYYSRQAIPSKSKFFCSKECSKKHKSKLASIHFKKIGSGGVRQSNHITYKGTNLGSSYELKLAILLDELGISWEKPKSFSYVKPDKTRSTYTPDFYLPEMTLYLDPKNDFLIHNINPGNKLKDIDKIAFVVEQNDIAVAIIDKENITVDFIKKMVGQEGFEPSVILSCKDSGFDHSHHCPIVYL